MDTILMKKVVNIVLSFLFGSQLLAQASDSTNMNILFIGNSYTHMNDMPKLFGKLAKAKGYEVNVEKTTQSGASFQVHTTRIDLWDKIKSKQWDYIVLQGYSRELSEPLSQIDTATLPYIQRIVDSVRSNNPCTQLLLYMTWGYKNGFLDREEVDTYSKMTEKISSGYRYISDVLNIPIVPVGQVWKEVIAQYPSIELYDLDQAHPSKKGSYVTACAFYAAIFKDNPKGLITSSIESEYAYRLQDLAGTYVLNNFKTYKLYQNRVDVKSVITVDGKFLLFTKANYPNSSSIVWDFGDGQISTDTNPNHEYMKPGDYTIIVTIDDECGIRTVKKAVSFQSIMTIDKAKPQPSKPTKKI
jgi:hypothetical protein